MVAFVGAEDAEGGEAVGVTGAVAGVDVCHEVGEGEGIEDSDVGLDAVGVIAVVAPFFVDVDELLLEDGIFA